MAKVLIIEDNPDAAASMALLLELSGHQVTVAHDGDSGIAQTQQQRPDVVLCDIGLPGSMDGYEVARALRADPALRATYLIALTGYGDDEDQERAHAAGFDKHLLKPVDPLLLRRLLASALPRAT